MADGYRVLGRGRVRAPSLSAAERLRAVRMTDEHPHPRHRAYRRAVIRTRTRATIAAETDETPFDPLIPSDVVGGGDPGIAEVLARHAFLDERGAG